MEKSRREHVDQSGWWRTDRFFRSCGTARLTSSKKRLKKALQSPWSLAPWGQSGDSLKLFSFLNPSAGSDMAVEASYIGVEAAVAAARGEFRPKAVIFDEFKLAGRAAVVSGGYGGLGLEMALALCEQGANVYCFDLPVEPSSDFLACAQYAEKLGSKLTYVQGDVTEPLGLNKIMRDIVEKEGRLDVCVCAAGILGNQHDCTEYPADEFRRIMEVNTNGVFFTAQAAAAAMVETQTPGSIIMIASMSGSITNRGERWVPYNTSKSAVLQMARSMACELGKHRIRVNSISPGHIYTKMTAAVLDKNPEQGKYWASLNPLGRLGLVHEVRGVTAFLASDASTFCTGSDLLVSGGHHAW